MTCPVLPRLHLQTQECFAPGFSLAVDPASPWHHLNLLPGSLLRLQASSARCSPLSGISFQGAPCLQQHLKQTQESDFPLTVLAVGCAGPSV